MVGDREFHLPDFDESSIAAVHLLQGVVYHDEGKVWDLVLSHQTRLDSYFGRIGLRLVVDLPEGFAFLRQLDDGELDHVRGYDQLPKLFHKKRLSMMRRWFACCCGRNCGDSRKRRSTMRGA